MAPSAVLKHRFQNSLDMIAARSMRNHDRAAQSGTGNAWCIVDSPTLGWMSSSPRRADISLKLEESTMATGSRLASQAVSVAPLNIRKNIKKIRRRALVSDVHLDLPPSPRPVPSPPQTAITFTAEWDLTQKAFVFTPFETSCPLSTTSSQFARSPFPVGIDEDFSQYSPALSTPSIYSMSLASPRHPGLSTIQTTWPGKSVATSIASTSSLSPDSIDSSPSTPVSDIFDRESLYSHGRKLSQSTTSSSVIDLPEEASPGGASKDGASHSFKELNRSVPSVMSDRSSMNLECYTELDHDLLVAPLNAFEQMLYESTETEFRAVQRHASVKSLGLISRRPSRPLPDVPRSAESTNSIYSAQSRTSTLNTPLPASNSLRQQFQTQIGKAFFGAMLLKR